MVYIPAEKGVMEMDSKNHQRDKQSIAVIIPACNEALSVGKVIREIPSRLVDEVIVVDNRSEDNTAEVARKAGATVLFEQKRGYGHACLKGMDYLKHRSLHPDIVVFLDADYSDHPGEMNALTAPIREGAYDLVIGSRILGNCEKGALRPQQIFGNRLAVLLMRLFYGMRFTDLGPFRAIRYDQLMALHMQDKTYGWTVEMQVKAAKRKLKCCEVPVAYRKRIGRSKVSGTVKGTLLAGMKIMLTIFKYI